MTQKKNILAIIGSASNLSANQKLVNIFADLTQDIFNLTVFNDLKSLPHFDPELSGNNPPPIIQKLRTDIEQADGVLICTPEYVFSIPSGLKNMVEWCVATTIFSNKPTALITASADGHKGHEELQLIMKTLMAQFTEETTLLISGIKGKIDAQGQLKDKRTLDQLIQFSQAFQALVFNERI
jgi:chromate reductase, NAD(P)H dehydrogenase (quinone)